MNVLIFTFSILMLLSLMSYGALQKYVDLSTTQTVYLRFMEESIRGYASTKEKKRYNNLNITKESPDIGSDDTEDDDTDKTTPKGAKNPLLDITSLSSTHTREIVLNLIAQLYSNKPFFSLDDPAFLLDRIVEMHNESSLIFSNANHLSNLDLQDDEMQEILYKMLKWQDTYTSNGSSITFTFSDLVGFPKADEKKLWVYYAHTPLLDALLGDTHAASILAHKIREIYREVLSRDEGSSIKDLENLLESETRLLLDTHGFGDYDQYLSYSINPNIPPQLVGDFVPPPTPYQGPET